MFDDLESINWHELRHSYGPADDVPDMLRGLLSPDLKVRCQAQSDLQSKVLHQGDIHSATLAVVPIFLKLLDDPRTPDRGWIAGYLGNVANSVLEHQYTENMEVYNNFGELVDWKRDLFPAYEIVRQGLPLFLRLLDDPEVSVRHGVVYALEELRDDAEEVDNVLLKRLAHEENQWIRADIHLARANLAPDPTARHRLLIAACETEKCEGTRFTLAVRVVREMGNETPETPLTTLIEGIPSITDWTLQTLGKVNLPSPMTEAIYSQAKETEMTLRFALDAISPNLYMVALALCKVDAHRIQTVLSPLLEAMRAVEVSSIPVFFLLQALAMSAVHIAFPDEAAPFTRESLTSEQVASLTRIAESERLWRYAEDERVLRNLLEPLGVPYTHDGLLRYLHFSSPES